VTGSAGKTTAKTMIAQVLSAKFSVLANQASYNNHLGVPLNLTRIDPGHTHVVAEIGTNHPGEIAHLAGLVHPDVAVITNIGWAHAGNFADHDALAAEKTDLLRATRPGGAWVVNGDDPQLARIVPTLPATAATLVRCGFGPGNDVRAVNVEVDEHGTRGILRFAARRQDVPFTLAAAGRHFASSAMLAVAVGELYGIDPATAVAALQATAPPPGRAALHRQADDLLMLDDSYNASPDAMLASLDLLGSLPGTVKIAVLGEMRELGATSADLHRRVGRATATHATHLITVGDDTAPLQEEARAGGLPADRAHTAGSAREALALVREILEDCRRATPPPRLVVLAKGARFRHMERIPLGLAGRDVSCPKALCTLYINCSACDQLSAGG
jgi:UDP-N-acetylmuramoyl-tripeptide--D-alanyl-D-alanine ligase